MRKTEIEYTSAYYRSRGSKGRRLIFYQTHSAQPGVREVSSLRKHKAQMQVLSYAINDKAQFPPSYPHTKTHDGTRSAQISIHYSRYAPCNSNVNNANQNASILLPPCNTCNTHDGRIRVETRMFSLRSGNAPRGALARGIGRLVANPLVLHETIIHLNIHWTVEFPIHTLYTTRRQKATKLHRLISHLFTTRIFHCKGYLPEFVCHFGPVQQTAGSLGSI